MDSEVKKTVLFLCTGNSCRSQMAEAMTNHFYGDAWIAESAGIKPTGYVHPLVLQVLEEIGVSHRGTSKSTGELQRKSYDLVMTVCDQAREECPVWLGDGRKIHHSYPDPAQAEGTPEEVIEVFRSVRDQIRTVLDDILKQ